MWLKQQVIGPIDKDNQSGYVFLDFMSMHNYYVVTKREKGGIPSRRKITNSDHMHSPTGIMGVMAVVGALTVPFTDFGCRSHTAPA